MVTSRMRGAGVLCLTLLTHCTTEPNGNGGADGTEIIFTRFPDVDSHESDLYIVAPDGSGLRPLVDGATIDNDPAWSPDGQRIVFASYGRPTGDGLYVMNRDGGDIRLLSTSISSTNPAWSPDGLQIAFAADVPGSIYLMNADGSGEHVLAPSDQISGLNVLLSHPTWSPDGVEVVFGAFEWSHGGGSLSIWRVNADGTGLGRLPLGEAGQLYLDSPAWSPDGLSIAFLCSTGFYSTRDICLVPVGGGTPTVFALEGDELFLTWSPDGRALAFVRRLEGSDDALMIRAVNGGAPRLLATAPAIHGISWGPAP